MLHQSGERQSASRLTICPKWLLFAGKLIWTSNYSADACVQVKVCCQTMYKKKKELLCGKLAAKRAVVEIESHSNVKTNKQRICLFHPWNCSFVIRFDCHPKHEGHSLIKPHWWMADRLWTLERKSTRKWSLTNLSVYHSIQLLVCSKLDGKSQIKSRKRQTRNIQSECQIAVLPINLLRSLLTEKTK